MAIADLANVFAAKEPEQNETVRYLAHVRQDEEVFIPHDLDEHLHGVAQRAEDFLDHRRRGKVRDDPAPWYAVNQYGFCSVAEWWSAALKVAACGGFALAALDIKREVV